MKKILLVTAVFLVFIQEAYPRKKCPLQVASFNIRYENPHDGINSWTNRKDMVNALISFHDFDIFGVQEALIGQINDILRLKQYAFIGKGRDDGEHGGEHCAIIYRKDRFKLLNSGDFWLSETPDRPSLGWDAPNCKRICSWGLFRDLNTKEKFYFFSVHFDHQGAEARRQSGKLMVKKIKEIAGEMPVICVGDFNSAPQTEQIADMQTILRDAFKVTRQAPYGPEFTTNGFGRNLSFDRMIRRDSTRIMGGPGEPQMHREGAVRDSGRVVQIPQRRPDGMPDGPGFRRAGSRRIDYIFVSPQFNVMKYGVLTDSNEMRFPSDHFPIVAKVDL